MVRILSSAVVLATVVVNVLALAGLLQAFGLAQTEWREPFATLGAIYSSYASMLYDAAAGPTEDLIGFALPAWAPHAVAAYAASALAVGAVGTGIFRRKNLVGFAGSLFLSTAWPLGVIGLLAAAFRGRFVSGFIRTHGLIALAYVAAVGGVYAGARYVNAQITEEPDTAALMSIPGEKLQAMHGAPIRLDAPRSALVDGPAMPPRDLNLVSPLHAFGFERPVSFSGIDRVPINPALDLDQIQNNLTAEQKADPRYQEMLALYNEGKRLLDAGQYAAAIEPFHKARVLSEELLGPDDPITLILIGREASALQNSGRYEEAEPLYLRALEASERVLGPDHPETLIFVNNLALLYRDQGRYEEAEPLLVRVLEGFERELGPDHPWTLNSVNNLALLYHDQGRYEEAEPLYLRALEARERVLGPDHLSTLGSLNNLAELYRDQGRYEEAEPLYLRVLEGIERVLGPDDPETLILVNNLALLYSDQGRYEEAEPLYLRALEARERVLGPDHPDTLTSVHNLALLYHDPYLDQGRYEEAEPLVLRALEGRERALGPDHPETLKSAESYAVWRAAAVKAGYVSDWPGDAIALAHLAKVLPAFDRALAGVEFKDADRRNPGSSAGRALRALAVYERLVAAGLPEMADANYRDPAFTLAQRFRSSSAAKAMAAAAQRLAFGDDEKAELLSQYERAEQAVRDEQSTLDALKSVSTRSESAIAQSEARLSELRAELDRITERLAEEGLAEALGVGVLSSVVSKEASLDLLKSDEALLLFTSANRVGEYLVFVNRPGSGTPVSLGVRRSAIDKQIKALREGLQLPFTTDPESGKTVPSEDPNNLPSYDLGLAHDLYETLIAPLTPHLEGVKRLIIVADGPLQSLPFSVLVTEPAANGTRFERLKETRYLVDEFAVVVYPSVSALETLRAETPRSDGGRPFLGFGDPILKPSKEDDFAPVTVTADDVDQGTIVALGGAGDWETIEDLPELRATGPMLEKIGETMGADIREIYLRGYAQEADLRFLNDQKRLKNYKILAFATHALVSDEIEALDLKEPAIVLSRPYIEDGSEPPALNNGLFRASDVIDLDLDADIVILAACNTAAPDGQVGAEPLSGLAKSFLLRGARSLLVSHWQADAWSTAKLVPRMVELSADQGFAKALQQSKIELRQQASNDNQTLHYAHPAIWGTFTLIGQAD